MLKFRLISDTREPNVLYAFVSGEIVLYIGKTAGPRSTLKQRLSGYATPSAGQSTNLNGKQRIRKCLSDDRYVDIYAFPDDGSLYHGGFHVNLADGLERDLIAQLAPAWNKMGMPVE